MNCYSGTCNSMLTIKLKFSIFCFIMEFIERIKAEQPLDNRFAVVVWVLLVVSKR